MKTKDVEIFLVVTQHESDDVAIVSKYMKPLGFFRVKGRTKDEVIEAVIDILKKSGYERLITVH